MIRALTLVALVLSAIPNAAFAGLVPALPMTESQFLAPDPVPAAAAAGADVTPFVTLIRDTLVAVLLAVLTAAAGWLTAQVSKWTAGRVRLEDLQRDLQMETYARSAVNKAFAYGLARVGVSWENLADVQARGQVLQYAVGFMRSQYPEIVRWIDKDQNGVIDWIETYLPQAKPPIEKATRPRTIKSAPPPSLQAP